MTCLGCNQIETSPVTLHTGVIVCSSCEAWRHETEARQIMGLPSTAARREWLDAIEKRRGAPSSAALQDTIRALWPSR